MNSRANLIEAQAIWAVLGEHGPLWLSDSILRLMAIGDVAEARRLGIIGRCMGRLGRRRLHSKTDTRRVVHLTAVDTCYADAIGTDI
ncbi:hypothetical protein ASG67_17275 [Sphingomonas sp. Leaf339]|nr:hypothetical protein ASG67_17275 [Sphingomonas sp. Leaf339]